MQRASSFNYHKIFTYFIAMVWLINGLFCKVFNLVPRHQDIVASILGEEYAVILTVLIGLAEIGMAIWIVSRILPRFNTVVQIGIVLMMNILEFILVPNLLLWGRINILFAIGFVLLVYCNEFVLKKRLLTE